MFYQFITTNAQLATYCAEIQSSQSIALDTEFVRTRTFYPQIGLIQVFNGQIAALIDPLDITEWDCFLAILADTTIQKYFHACSEDIEVFSHHFNVVPTPIIDSQVLASFLDNPISAGYASLVKKYLDVDLDKSEVRTDWLQRPLTTKQCDYAINDVLYLLPLMDKLKALLLGESWLNAAYDECQLIVDRKCEQIEPKDAYLQIKNNWQLNGKGLGVLQKLAMWRYHLAQTEDIALNFVVHEEVLWKIARYHPTSLAELANLGMKGKEIRLYGETVLRLLTEPVNEMPPIKRINSYPDYKKMATVLKQTAESIAKQTGLNVELLLSRRFINHYVKWQHDKTAPLPEILSGWRKPLFEKSLNTVSL